MPTLKEMNNVQRAKLLCSLIPEEIPKFLEALQQYCDTITSDQAAVHRSFENNPNPIISAGEWIYIAQDVQVSLGKCKERLHKSSNLFADQLFGGYLALFTSHCVNLYKEGLPEDNKFRQAAALLFY